MTDAVGRLLVTSTVDAISFGGPSTHYAFGHYAEIHLSDGGRGNGDGDVPHLTIADLASRTGPSPLYKATKASVNYTAHAMVKAERCALCAHFLAPHNCEIVEGRIASGGWCKRFKRKANEQKVAAKG